MKEQEKYAFQHEEFLKEANYYSIKISLINGQTSLDKHNGISYEMDEIYSGVVEEVADTPYAANAFNMDDNRAVEVDFVDGFGSTDRLYPVKSRKNYEIYNKKASQLADEMEADIDTLEYEDEAGLKEKEFLKAYIVRPIKRAVSGYPDSYLVGKLPLIVGTRAIGACIESRIDGGKVGTLNLHEKIAAYGDKYPIYDICINTENAVQSFADYYEDKKNGELSENAINNYRQSIYSDMLKLIDNYDKLVNTIINPEEKENIRNNGLLASGNDPSHLHPLASRGCTAGIQSADAYKAGIENGWPLEDLGTLASYAILAFQTRRDAEYVTNTSLNGVKKKDNPYANKNDLKEFLTGMDEIYKRIKTTPIKSADQRKQLLEEMNNKVQEGYKKGYFVNESYRYFRGVYEESRSRDKQIEKGKETAFSSYNVKKNMSEVDKINYNSISFNSKRSSLLLGRESDEHKRLRESCEAYKKLVDKSLNEPLDKSLDKSLDKPLDKFGYDAQTENFIERLEVLDEMQFTAHNYIRAKTKAGVSSSAGKRRLRGAKQNEKFAIEAKRNLMKEMREKGYDFPGDTFESLRQEVSEAKAQIAIEKISRLDRFPNDKEEIKSLKDAVADVMMAKYATSKNEAIHRVYNRKGARIMKQELLKSSEFNDMVSKYMKQKNMTPALMAEELKNNAAMAKMKKMNESINKQHASEMKQKQKIQQAKQKRQPQAAQGGMKM